MIFIVAPLVGAWIEIRFFLSMDFAFAVAPLVGAWIEITKPSVIQMCPWSLPSWERGLK